MRILHLTSHLDVGGITTYVTSLAQALAARGHRVVVASGGGACEERLREAGVEHWRLPLKTSAEFSPQVCWAAWRLSPAVGGVDVIHAHTRVAQVVAHWLSARCGIPYVTTWHGFYRRRLSRRWWPCTGELTIAISEPVAAHLREVFGVPPERIRLIPHGIDVARWAQPVDPAAQQQLRERCHLDHGPVIGTIARLVPDKGVAQLLEAFRHVQARVPHARLMIVGGGEDRPRLERLAGALGVAEAVRFLGNVSDTRVVLSIMDLFVFLPATREGFGLALLEAMAGARPVVAVQRGGGSSWVLQESGVGVTVPADAPARLGEAMLQVLEDPSLARRLGQEAQAMARSRYDFSRVVTQVEQVYEEVIATRECGMRNAECGLFNPKSEIRNPHQPHR